MIFVPRKYVAAGKLLYQAGLIEFDHLGRLRVREDELSSTELGWVAEHLAAGQIRQEIEREIASGQREPWDV
jgi:hypothetical protein